MPLADISQWRARIGAWNCCQWRRSLVTSSGFSQGDCDDGIKTCSKEKRNIRSRSSRCSRAGVILLLISTIICLFTFFLILSGDVETNPGPTLTDQPTLDELVEVLSSSLQFGGWEQFVCHLPNMSQEIIDDIKQREPADNIMSAIAQYWLDNSGEGNTWKDVIEALERADERQLVLQVQERLQLSENRQQLNEPQNQIQLEIIDIESVRKTIKDVFVKHFALLNCATKSSIESVSSSLFSKNLITRDVCRFPSYDKIHDEFTTGLRWETNTESLQKRCQEFLNCISEVAKDNASLLADDLEKELLSCHRLNVSFKRTCVPFIELSSKDEVAKEISCLQRSFLTLVTKIREYYDESGHHKLINMARWLEEYLEQTGYTKLTKIDELFGKIQEDIGYDFLNCEIIKDLVEEFPIQNDKLFIEFNNYIDNWENFDKSVPFKLMIDNIETALKDIQLCGVCEVVIKLTGRWGEKNIKNLRKVINYIFSDKGKFVKLIEVRRGSIIITFIVPCSQVPSLLLIAKMKVSFLSHIGIFYISINKQLILDERDNVGFTFEQSLVHSIKNISEEREFEKIAFLLIELTTNLNYRNEEGQTALMLASNGGHIEVFKSLLWNNADPTITQANGDYTGLNSLACTALSEHMYKSVGGEKILPQNGTTIKEMLDEAIAKGVYDPFLVAYDPFVSLIISKLYERFRHLQTRFERLTIHFTTALTESVIGKGVNLSDLKRYLCSYIEHDTTTDIHQLMSALQSHYSCLNVHLMADISKQYLERELQDQVESYMTELKTFERTTQLLELKMATDQSPIYQPTVHGNYTELIIKFNNQWGSRTLADLHKFENFLSPNLHRFLNLIQAHQKGSMLVCVYLIPHSQTEPIGTAVMEYHDILTSLGICEILIDDIPLIVEENNNQFTFETTLQQAVRTNDTLLKQFLFDLNIKLPTQVVPYRRSSSDSEDEEPSAKVTMIPQFQEPEVHVYDENLTREEQMFEAIKLHDVRYVRKLLRKGCDVDYVDYANGDLKTFLMIASMTGNLEIVQLLLSQSPDINMKDQEGNTALIYASIYGHNDIVKLLLEDDSIEIDAQNNEGMTALIFGACRNHKDVVESLLEKGADSELRNESDMSAYDFANRNGFRDIEQLLMP